MSKPFLELRDQLLRLRADPATTEAEAVRTLRVSGIQAARATAQEAKAGRIGIPLELLSPKPSSVNPAEHDALWHMCWLMLLQHLQARFSHRLRPHVGDGDERIIADHPDKGLCVSVETFPPDRWRQRAEDYASALLLLDELATHGSDSGAAATPNDLIRMRVALERFKVSRSTLKRDVANGTLRSYRRNDAPSNAEHLFSERELAAKYERL